jgi:DNA-binding PadR family transcriptional regulator
MSDLLFLSLLVHGKIRNYQIKDALLRSEDIIAGIKKGTSYNILRRLERYGHIVASVEHEGNRLERRVYETTDPRCKAFESILQENLSEVFISLFDQIELDHS